MTPRERFHAIVAGEPFDRLPILEWATWWDKTIERWRNEGLLAAWQDGNAISDGLGLDCHRQWWIRARRPTCPPPRAHQGGLIDSMDDYLRLREHLYPSLSESPAMLARWRNWARLQKDGDAVLWITLDGFFWFPRILLGVENHLLAFYDQPELLQRICQDLADWHLRILDELIPHGVPDFMTFAEDMSYNHGPMLSEGQFDEFLYPYYLQVTPALARHGVLPIVDSDGDVTLATPWFERAGVRGILPLERQAGVDVAILQQAHPRMVVIGHFDKLTMSRGEEAMRTEFERLLPMARRGRFLISCDHQTPPEVSYRDYATYLRLFREYAVRAGSGDVQ